MKPHAFEPDGALGVTARPTPPGSRAWAPSPELEKGLSLDGGRSPASPPPEPSRDRLVHRPGENAPLLTASGLTKAYGATLALDGVDLSLGPGEVLALLGPNGAGKTTLLRILATLLRPTAGQATVLGHDVVRERAAIRAQSAFLGAGAHCYGELTAAENLRFAARLRGAPADAGAIAKALEAVGLGGAGARRARAFSTGMQRRLALARVLLCAPALLFLDEPYLALDREAAALLDRTLAAQQARGGGAVLALHQLGRAYAVCDRFALLQAGRLVWTAARAATPLAALRAAYQAAGEEALR